MNILLRSKNLKEVFDDSKAGKLPTFPCREATPGSMPSGEYAGRTLVIYFYPKDNTPGCTKEACGFRDLHAEFHLN